MPAGGITGIRARQAATRKKKRTAKKSAPAKKAAPKRDTRPTVEFSDKASKVRRFNKAVRDASRANTPASPAARQTVTRGGQTANENARNQFDARGNVRNAPRKPKQRRKKKR